MADPHAERCRVRREECSCHSSRLVLFLLLHRKRQTSPRIKGRHLSYCSPRWRSFIYEAYSILPGHLREAAFQPMLHQFRSAAARFAEPTANIDNVVNVLYTVILKYSLDTVVAIVIEFFKVLVIFVMTGLLYHIFSKFLRRVDIWCEIKLIEVFCQLADICCARRFRHLADSTEFLKICILKICARLTQSVQLKQGFLFKIQCAVNFIRKPAA